MPLGGDYHWLLTTLYSAVNDHKHCRISVEDPVTMEFTIDSTGTLDDVILHIEEGSLECSANLIFDTDAGTQENVAINHISVKNVEENSNSRPGAFFKYYIWHEGHRGCACINVNDK